MDVVRKSLRADAGVSCLIFVRLSVMPQGRELAKYGEIGDDILFFTGVQELVRSSLIRLYTTHTLPNGL